MKKAVIYKIVNSKNGKIYIGSTVNFSRRKQRHFQDLKNNNHHCLPLQRAYNKYGVQYFSVEKIEIFEYNSVENILVKEQYYLDNFKPEYNVCKIAGSQLGSKRSKQARLNMSKGQKGRKVWNAGLKTGPLSEETKKNMSKAQKKRMKKYYKKVAQFSKDGEFIKEFKSLTDCSNKLNLQVTNLTACLKGRRKTCGGYTFKYI